MNFDRQRMIDLRESKGISQSGLADLVGVKRQQLAGWENGKHVPSVKAIGKIGEALGVSGTFFIVERKGGSGENGRGKDAR